MVLAPSTVKLPLVQYSILNTGAGEHILEVHILRTILNLTDDTVFVRTLPVHVYTVQLTVPGSIALVQVQK